MQAAKASRKMTFQDRLQIMVKAGLVSRDQVEQFKLKLNPKETTNPKERRDHGDHEDGSTNGQGDRGTDQAEDQGERRE
jgi:hypothetical protein